jgi:Kef-type K+ transport system membrane component KefB
MLVLVLVLHKLSQSKLLTYVIAGMLLFPQFDALSTMVTYTS